jgi:predicted RNA-binding protein YlxR (DUF448 family)
MKVRKIPQRKCIACQKMLSKKEMVRIVRTPDGAIEVDLTGKKNGRGAYICGKTVGFALAKKQRSLERALKTNIDPDVYDELEQLFARMNDNFRDVECELNHEQ